MITRVRPQPPGDASELASFTDFESATMLTIAYVNSGTLRSGQAIPLCGACWRSCGGWVRRASSRRRRVSEAVTAPRTRTARYEQEVARDRVDRQRPHHRHRLIDALDFPRLDPVAPATTSDGAPSLPKHLPRDSRVEPIGGAARQAAPRT